MSNSTSSDYDALQNSIQQDGIPATLQLLERILRRDQKFHELFEVLKMQLRHRFDLSLVDGDPGESLAAEQQKQYEDELVEACRDVGEALLAAGQIREGWMYLRPAVDRAELIRQLAQVTVTDENRDAVIEIALHEGIDVVRGYRLVLDHYGTCNAITTFQHFAHSGNAKDVQKAAAMLVEEVHRELLISVRSHVEREEGEVPESDNISDLIASRDWLFGEYSYHLDPSHLSSTVQAARYLRDPRFLRLAQQLTSYGERLHEQFQYPGDEPFGDIYPSHRLYFQAILGENQEESLAYFRERAQNIDAYEQGSQAAEIYIDLLARVGRPEEAIQAFLDLIPENVHTTGLAPDLLELARQASSYDKVLGVYRQRENLLGFASGLLEATQSKSS